MEQSEYLALKALYQSEGYGILIRLIDAKINIDLSKLLGGSVKDKDELFGIINNMRGLGKARSLVESTLKEEEVNFEKETN